MDGKQERADKFTPGPWAWGGKPGKSELSAAGGNKVFDYAGYEGLWFAACDEQRDAANACLIAAAPDMYAALTGLLTPDRRSVYATQEVIETARAALARAEGRP